MNISRIGSILPGVLTGISGAVPTQALRPADIECAWNDSLPETVRGHAYVFGMRQECLLVKADSNSYGMAIRLWKGEILRNLKIRGVSVKDIFILL